MTSNQRSPSGARQDGRVDTILSLVAITIIVCAHIVILFSARLLPLVDIPNHLAMATILRDYGEATNLFSSFYALDLFPKPNVFFLVFCGSPLVPSVELGAKCLFALYMVCVPLSVLLCIRSIGGSTWFAIPACLLLYNFNLTWGFVGYTLSVPFVIVAAWLAGDGLGAGRRAKEVLLAAVLVLLFFMHALSMLLALGMVALSAAWIHRADWRRAVRACWVLVPAVALLVMWQLNEARQEGGVSKLAFLPYYYRTQYLASWANRADFFMQDFRALTGDGTARWGGGLVSAGIVFAGLVGAWCARHKLTEGRMVPLVILGLLSLGGYLLFPQRFPGYHFLFERLSAPLLLVLIVFGSLTQGIVWRRAAGGLAVAASLWYVTLVADLYRGFNEDAANFTSDLFPSGTSDGVMAGLIFDTQFRNRAYYVHFLDYFIVWQRGIATTRVVDAKSFPVKRKVSGQLLPEYHEWLHSWLKSDEFRSDHYSGATYMLVKGKVPKKGEALLEGFEVDRGQGDWRLYKRTPE